jgi:hypothetical protein
MAWSMNMHVSVQYITVFLMLVDLRNERELEVFQILDTRLFEVKYHIIMQPRSRIHLSVHSLIRDA